MRPLRIQGFTRYLGKPLGWTPEQGECGNLAIRDEMTTAGPAMGSAWELLPPEIEAIKAGAPVILWVYGTGHPPVWLQIGEPPKEGEG